MVTKHSRRYLQAKEKTSPKKLSLSEALEFLLQNNQEKSKNIKASFTINWRNKGGSTLKSTVVYPHPFERKERMVVFKDNLTPEDLKELSQKDTVELIDLKSFKEIGLDEKGKLKKSFRKNLVKIYAHPKIETEISHLQKELKSLYPSKKNGCLTENVSEELKKINFEEKTIKSDKNGNFNLVIGKTTFSVEELKNNFQKVYQVVVGLRPHNQKGVFLTKVTLSTSMGPGTKLNLL